MARIPEPIDADLPINSPDDSSVSVQQIELLETFDDAIRARFGAFISIAIQKQPTKRRRAR